MARNTEHNPSVELSIEEEVEKKIKGKYFNDVKSFGAAGAFSIDNAGVDYTVGGRLSAKFVRNTPEDISKAHSQGYHFPSTIHSSLPERQVGANVLMLRPADATKRHKDEIAAKARAMAGKIGTEHEEHSKLLRQTPGTKKAYVPQSES